MCSLVLKIKMATVFENVNVSLLGDDSEFVKKYSDVKIEIQNKDRIVFLALTNGELLLDCSLAP